MTAISGKVRGASRPGQAAVIAVATTLLLTACSDTSTMPTQPESPDVGANNQGAPSVDILPTFRPPGGYAGDLYDATPDLALNSKGCLVWGKRIALFPDGTVTSEQRPDSIVLPDGGELEWTDPGTVSYFNLSRIADPTIKQALLPCRTGPGPLRAVFIVSLDE